MPHPPFVQGPRKPRTLLLAAIFEAEPLVVRPDSGEVALAVEPYELASACCSFRVDPLDDALAEPAAGERAADDELVQVDRVGRTLAPEERIVEQEGERCRRLPVELYDVKLAA